MFLEPTAFNSYGNNDIPDGFNEAEQKDCGNFKNLSRRFLMIIGKTTLIELHKVYGTNTTRIIREHT